jgi:fructokinase
MTPTIVGLGEALFDQFAGRMSLGGAPLNFAIQAHRLAAPLQQSAAVASRIGADPLGERLITEVSAAGVDPQFLQVDPERPTGVVPVALDPQRQASYSIEPGAAWDFLEFTPEWEALAHNARAVCFGTLAQRSEPAREAIESFLTQAKAAIRLFDVNLRQDFYDYSVLRRGCCLATAVKCNEEELAVLAEMLALRGNTPGDWIHSLFDRFPVESVLLTRGPRGSQLYLPNGRFEEPPPSYPHQEDADSVGAGDAASAALVVALLAQLPPAEVVSLANHAGAFVASQPGATPQLPASLLARVR